MVTTGGGYALQRVTTNKILLCFLVEFRVTRKHDKSKQCNKNVLDTVYGVSWLLLDTQSCASNLTILFQFVNSWCFNHGVHRIDFARIWPELNFRSCVNPCFSFVKFRQHHCIRSCGRGLLPDGWSYQSLKMTGPLIKQNWASTGRYSWTINIHFSG